jgi:hypothetical protein
MLHQPANRIRLETVETQLPAKVIDLKASLENEINHRCHRKVTKRLALRLAHAIISDSRDGMFLAEKLVDELRPRIKHEAALREIYIDREVCG